MDSLTPATPIKLSEKKLTSLAGAVQNIITDLESQNGPLFDAIEIWEKNYEAIPKQKVKNFPFANASNIVVPLAKMMVDSRTASTWSSIHSGGSTIWVIESQNETEEDRSVQIQRYINWQADGNDFNMKAATYDWILESNKYGSSVLAGGWRSQQSFVYTKSGSGVKATPVNWNRGPFLEHVPRRQMLWDTSYPSISEAPVVVRQFAKTWPEIAQIAQNSDGWFNTNIEEVRDQPGMSGPGEAIRKTEDSIDNRGEAPSAFALHDIREVHISWPNINMMDIHGKDLILPTNMKVKTSLVDLVITIHRSTGKILRLQSQPYYYPGKPFFDTYFHKRTGRGHSVGMIKIIEGIQAAYTTVINQGLDAQTRANSIWAKTNIRELLEQPINPASPIWDPTMKGFESLNLPGNDFGNIQLTQVLQAMSERLSGQADPAFGRETRLGGHSAPATTTLALLERGNTLIAPDRGLLQQTLGRTGEFISTLNQQFETDEDGKIDRVLGEIDGALVKEIYFPTEPIPTNYRFTIKGLSKSDNPQQEIQTQIAIRDASQTYWGGILSVTEAFATTVAQSPPEIQPILLETYIQALKGQTQTFKRILNAADIDDIENFILSINDPRSPLAQTLEALINRAQQGAGPQGPPGEQGVVGQARIPVANGAAGPPGIPDGSGAI